MGWGRHPEKVRRHQGLKVIFTVVVIVTVDVIDCVIVIVGIFVHVFVIFIVFVTILTMSPYSKYPSADILKKCAGAPLYDLKSLFERSHFKTVRTRIRIRIRTGSGWRIMIA